MPPYASANLATHVGDEAGSVARNRSAISEVLGISTEWATVEQVHGAEVVDAAPGGCGEADALLVSGSGIPAAVFVADCLPVLLVADSGTHLAVVHAGWRGLRSGVIEAAGKRLEQLGGGVGQVVLGPSIGPCCYEVGAELARDFTGQCGAAVARERGEKFFLDLKAVAEVIAERRWPDAELLSLGPCTHDEELFSYRGDGGITGRQALIAWIV